MQSTGPGIWPLLNVGSYSHGTPSSFLIRDYKDLRKSKPGCYCKQIKTRGINFRVDNGKHTTCQGSSFSFGNNAIHPQEGFSFPETYVLSDYHVATVLK